MKKKKIEKVDIKVIDRRDVSKEEMKENERKAKKYKLMLYTLPIILLVTIAIVYILTNINYLLIPFGVIFLLFLFGWDANQRTCKECRCWNSVMWTDSKIVIRTTNKTKKSLLGKDITKSIKEKVNVSTGKCKNCGKEITIEKSRRI